MNDLQLVSQQDEETPVSSPSKKKTLLKIRIIKHLHRQGSKSIPELCEVVRMSSPTLKRVLVELEAEGIIIEQGLGASCGGRRPFIYGLNPNSRYIVGIDLGRFETRVGLFNLACSSLGEVALIPDGLDTHPDVLSLVTEAIQGLLVQSSIPHSRVLGAGISVPGLLDSKTGISHCYFQELEVPLAVHFRKLLGLPVFVEHNNRAMARGELMFGLARDKKNVLCLNLGSGIGLSMIMNGHVYAGESGYAGEFGHINVDPEGQLCYCGKIGCLETLASGRTLREIVRKDLEGGTKSLIRDLISNDMDQIRLPFILQAAASGDQYAIKLLATTGMHLGKGVATLIHLFNPELIIIGGALSNAGNLLLDPVQQNLNAYCIPRIRQDATIKISELGDHAGMMGAVALVMDQVFDSNIH